jgi:hypothetical protein
MDFYLVASSLQELEADGRKAISREKVARLRAAIDGR